jgi:hypothetical protein
MPVIIRRAIEIRPDTGGRVRDVILALRPRRRGRACVPEADLGPGARPAQKTGAMIADVAAGQRDM